MLTRLYVDNYKCFQNFELKLGPEHLFMGANGTGKTTIFEILWSLRSLVLGERNLVQLFPESSRTRWDKRSRQTFELDLRAAGKRYLYRLGVDRPSETSSAFIDGERLEVDGRVALDRKKDTVTLWGSAGEEDQSYVTHVDSSVALFPPGVLPEAEAFADVMRSIWLVRIDPLRMAARSESETDSLAPDLSNFSSWYRSANLERSELGGRITESLRDIWDGFGGLRSVSVGEGIRTLKTEWTRPFPATYSLEELSEGQRALIGLYAVMHWLEDKDATLLLDEPDNFLALREIQPLINSLSEKDRLQRLIISHHPSIIDLKARSRGITFERTPEGHIRWSPFDSTATSLPPSEIVARGWDDG